ncbi:dATP pyrophosphohydrolase [Pantoea sp. SORGH_AS 659]|nr:dATP pyrophosphohydrolase [Pantoea sp. SORGH_AS_0659]
MGFKHPVSVLVVIFARDTGRVLMLQRRDDDSFWQSVTGSLEAGETPRQAAQREVLEELAIDIAHEKLVLDDCHKQIEFEIFPHYRHRYAPGTTHNREHWFRLAIPRRARPAAHRASRRALARTRRCRSPHQVLE